MKVMETIKHLLPGTTLPNGATVLYEDGGVILAFQESTMAPFITWRWDQEDPRTTCWGNYFKSLAQAAVDFEERLEGVKRNG
jgi:hypothetical protein